MKNSTIKTALFLVVAVLGHLSNLALGGSVTAFGEGKGPNVPQGADSFCDGKAEAFFWALIFDTDLPSDFKDNLQFIELPKFCMNVLENGYNKGYQKGTSECPNFETNMATPAKFVRG